MHLSLSLLLFSLMIKCSSIDSNKSPNIHPNEINNYLRRFLDQTSVADAEKIDPTISDITISSISNKNEKKGLKKRKK
jgi:hypothetical protein